MTETGHQRISVQRFLALSVNMLDSYFFRANKEKARKLFKEIEAGREVRVASLGLGDDRENKILIYLRLDHSEFQGHLTFHLFRIALSRMLKDLGERLRQKDDVRMYSAENTGDLMFFIPGIVEDRDKVNFLVPVLARGEGSMMRIKLQFLNPDQFKKQSTNADQPGPRAPGEPEVSTVESDDAGQKPSTG